MNKEKKISQWCVSLIFIFLLMGYNSQEIFAGTKTSGLIIQGDWSQSARSSITNIPITVSIDRDILLIQSTDPRSNITIRVSQGNEVVYEKIVPASETESIYNNLDYLEKGIYRLDLTNQWGDHLYGDFDIQK